MISGFSGVPADFARSRSSTAMAETLETERPWLTRWAQKKGRKFRLFLTPRLLGFSVAESFGSCGNLVEGLSGPQLSRNVGSRHFGRHWPTGIWHGADGTYLSGCRNRENFRPGHHSSITAITQLLCDVAKRLHAFRKLGWSAPNSSAPSQQRQLLFEGQERPP